MTLDEAIEHLEEKLQEENFPCEECRKEHLELQEWLEELRESRKVIKAIQEQLLNPNVCVLCKAKIGMDCD
ncbi:hypothetical protein FDB39_05585 [Clostridium botulinum]|nr:hypothetical protein [Clostridium botulinum]